MTQKSEFQKKFENEIRGFAKNNDLTLLDIVMLLVSFIEESKSFFDHEALRKHFTKTPVHSSKLGLHVFTSISKLGNDLYKKEYKIEPK
jgi:hypothetical protein